MYIIDHKNAVEKLFSFAKENMPRNQIQVRKYLEQFSGVKKEEFYFYFGLDDSSISVYFCVDFLEKADRRIRISVPLNAYTVSKAVAVSAIQAEVVLFAAKIQALFEDYTVVYND